MIKKSQLGIYFSDSCINIIEQQGGHISNLAKAPCDCAAGGIDQKYTVDEELRAVKLIKEELRKNNIVNPEVVLAISSQDLMIRFFEIPLVPRSELSSTIGFEAKKYIPFRLEEVVYDFQTKVDKKTKKIKVLFVAAKKETIDKYIAILDQIGLRIVGIEPVFLSTLRIVKLIGKVKSKDPVAIIDVDLQNGTGNMSVIADFYPLFHHDVKLKLETGKEIGSDGIILKLINEIRISIDYCRRQFPLNPINITELVLLTVNDDVEIGEALRKELEIPTISINVLKDVTLVHRELDLEWVRTYGASLMGVEIFPVKIDLFNQVAAAEAGSRGFDLMTTLGTITSQLDKAFVIVNIIIILGVSSLAYFLGLFQVGLYNRKIEDAKQYRGSISKLESLQDVSQDELTKIKNKYTAVITAARNINKNRTYFTSKLSTLGVLVPKGLWLNSFNFVQDDKKQRIEFHGLVYLGTEEKEFAVVNSFLRELENNSDFTDFKNIKLASLLRRKIANYSVAEFRIICE